MKISIGKKNTPFLSEKMFGLFFEDINYAADGGLYAEMLENRQFAFRKSTPGVAEKTYDSVYAGNYGYDVYPKKANVSLKFIQGDAVSENNPHYMQVMVSGNPAGFSNKAYDGICMKKGMKYHLTFFARTANKGMTVTFRVLQAKSKEIIAEGKQKITTGKEWKQYTLTVKALSNVTNGLFTVEQSEGCVDYGYLSLIPDDAVEGVFRKDLFEMIRDTNPGFLRFPGGCIVEGANLNNRYRWKDTVGLPWNRKWNWSRWAVHDVTMGQGTPLFYPFYNQSYGIGFYEYFLLAELMGAKALPVLSVGLACQFQSDELVPINTKEFDMYLQDALDLIEFANGGKNTKWGKIRCEMGHPKPFGLEYIGIGNEQWETDRVDFFARYSAFEKAIHAKYPDICLLGSAGPDVTTEKYTKAWDFYRKECKKNPNFTHAVDEHYYMPPKWFYEHIHMYDDYSRDIPVFAGEYAAHCKEKRNNMEAALAEAAFMCGLEKNGDVIRFASAAPLFARNGYVQWIPDYIWFDGDHVMGTPGYYVQKLFGAYTGKASVEYACDAAKSVYTAVSKDDNHYYVKIINSGKKSTELTSVMFMDEPIIGKNAKSTGAKLSVMQMSANAMTDENVLGKEDQIALREIKDIDPTSLTVPALSCTVLIIEM